MRPKAQKPKSPKAQKPKSPKAQKPKSPKAQKPLNKTFERLKIAVPYEFLEQCAKKNSCNTLNMYDPAKSTGKLISCFGKIWVCFGSTYRDKYTSCKLKEIIESRLYKGPPNDPHAGPEKFYEGGTFKVRGKSYTMLEHEIELIAAVQLSLGF